MRGETEIDIILADFGLAVQATTDSTRWGSPGYIAPEVFSKSYTNKVDMFSAGVVLYIMLSGI